LHARYAVIIDGRKLRNREGRRIERKNIKAAAKVSESVSENTIQKSALDKGLLYSTHIAIIV
jgi:hypothetical protein